MLIQIFIIVFALFALSRVIFRYKNDGITLFELVLWMLFWGLAIVVAIIPDTTNLVATIVGVGRGADLVVYSSLIILFYVVFKLLTRVYRLERDITKIVQNIALKSLERDDSLQQEGEMKNS